MKGRIYLGQCLKPQVMSLYYLDVVLARKSPIPVHDEADVSWHGTLLERADEQLADLGDCPFSRW